MVRCWQCRLRGKPVTQRQLLRAAAVQRAPPSRARTVNQDAEIMRLEDMNVSSLDRYKIHWYPGHMAAAERKLQEHLSRVDIVFDVRDARCLHSTEHPKVAGWVKGKRRFIIVNRTDMVSAKDLRLWRQHFQSQGLEAYFVNAQHGTGIGTLKQAAAAKSGQVNASRVRRGLKPRPVRACVIGYPNIGKSALINRLLGRRVVDSYKLPGVTRTLRWVRMSDELDLLDSPGIIPSQIKDQSAAVKLAICNDIGEASYLHSAVAAQFLTMVKQMNSTDTLWASVKRRYHFADGPSTSEDMVEELSVRRFDGQLEQAGQRILNDYRDLRLGRFALELPDK